MRRLIGIIGAGLALGACDDGGDGAAPAPCEVLGRGLAVGEQIEDLEACVVCTCHAPGEFGCQDLPFCGIDQGVTADAAPPRSARDAAPIVDAAPDCAQGTLRCDPADAARVEGCVGGRWIEAERCADGVTLTYGQSLTEALQPTTVRLDWNLGLTTGEALVVRRDLLDQAPIQRLAEHLQRQARTIAELFPDVEVVV